MKLSVLPPQARETPRRGGLCCGNISRLLTRKLRGRGRGEGVEACDPPDHVITVGGRCLTDSDVPYTSCAGSIGRSNDD